MTVPRRKFSDGELETLRELAILGVRSGTKHRYTAVWVVVLGRRVFARSWSDKPTGWYRAFRDHPQGSISLAKKSIPVRAAQTRSDRIRRAVSDAYAAKYDTKGSEKWVKGFAERQREATTVEFVRA